MSKSKIKFELDRDGVSELMKSSAMDAVLTAEAASKTAGLPAGYKSDLHHFKRRDAVYIYPETDEAKKDNWKNHTLTRLL